MPKKQKQKKEQEQEPEPDAMAMDVQDEEIQETDNISLSDKPSKIQVLDGSTENGASFQFENEDHTLGNALRYMIMKNPEVELCGYSIPHPAETKMNIRIQTYEGTTPVQALQKGLQDLEDLCDIVTDKFTKERDRFERTKV